MGAISSVATVLERRLHLLEEENHLLRADACQLAEDVGKLISVTIHRGSVLFKLLSWPVTQSILLPIVEKTEAQEKYLVEDAISRLSKLL